MEQECSVLRQGTGSSAGVIAAEVQSSRQMTWTWGAQIWSSITSTLATTHPSSNHPGELPLASVRRWKKTVGQVIKQGLGEKSSSPWSSAVVLVKKKDGSTRCCVDYRALNKVTVKDSYPLPHVNDTLDALAEVKWFSTLDLKLGYHQVEMAEEDKEKTAFTFGRGL